MLGLGDVGPDRVQCSRAGCTAVATRSVNWRNPKIHGLERVKVWSACDEHVDYLSDFLLARDFPVVVTAAGVTVDSVGAAT
ncbi:hypothetical protein SOM11_03550 [Frigoribacterium sp. CFBP9039]|uniref:hypothetical protein n=1 Tax=Frigoribacterium TaxID=96492 RepID=UPI001FACF810|nr:MULTISPECIES: hypothetical protein [Frigoribacterium]MCJ0699623.1 hypothetical protein [Frigoribacterium faeni]MDY0890988.1 hypothetical protein [Frigoribacterium sp. CFBP9030]MDY0945053.1 hypothetical protein [Frigoribacterium sp. CFBP9039]